MFNVGEMTENELCDALHEIADEIRLRMMARAGDAFLDKIGVKNDERGGEAAGDGKEPNWIP